MDIDYDRLAEKIAEKIQGQPSEKKLTGRAYWAALRREKNKLTENIIPPQSGAQLVTQSEYETLVKLGLENRLHIRLKGEQR